MSLADRLAAARRDRVDATEVDRVDSDAAGRAARPRNVDPFAT